MVSNATFSQIVGANLLHDGSYESLLNPISMGNLTYGYGGCTLGFGMAVAHEDVKEGFHCYSATGYYLGPAQTDRRLYATTSVIRDTRVFATRQVQVFQKHEGGKTKPCLVMFVDFQAREPSLMDFSSPPRLGPWKKPEELLDAFAHREAQVKAGKISKKLAVVHQKTFALHEAVCEQRRCEESVGAQNMMGMMKKNATSQDSLSLTEKATADYFRSKERLTSREQHIAALSFVADGALAFIPLTHNHMFLDDAGACSSLDFSVRFFSAEIDMNEWILREMGTVAGGEGRTYSECRFWDGKGKMIAVMSQNSILRPPQKKVSKI